MPLAYAAVALVVAGAGVLGAWSFGYRAGEQKARAELALRESVLPGLNSKPAPEGSTPHETPREPPHEAMVNAPETPSTGITPATGSQGGLSGKNRTSVLDKSNPPSFLVNGHPVPADPRLPMHNYLQLSSGLGLTDVVAVSRIFADRGMDCFAAVDPRSLKRKDGPLFVVWAGLGFPSGEANSDNAQRYKDQVLAAGTTWKQAGGTTDFADAFWKLYKP